MLLSSNLLSFLAMAGFALTTATAEAVQPRAAAAVSNKICTSTFYSTPQCCIPNENGLDKPDCITREFSLNRPPSVPLSLPFFLVFLATTYLLSPPCWKTFEMFGLT